MSHPVSTLQSVPTPPAAAPEPADALAIFRARLEAGRFNAVLGRAMRRTLHDAAAEFGLEAEVGAIRLALARLLHEEQDPSRLAAGVARLAAVAVQAARLRQPVDSGVDAVQAAILREIEAIDAEIAAGKDPLMLANYDEWHQIAGAILGPGDPARGST
jgi:hypothetical protein